MEGWRFRIDEVRDLAPTLRNVKFGTVKFEKVTLHPDANIRKGGVA